MVRCDRLVRELAATTGESNTTAVFDAIALRNSVRSGSSRKIATIAEVSTQDLVISAATLLECSLVMHRKRGDEAVERLDSLLQTAGVRCMAVDAAQALAARDAWVRYGKGRSPAKLNFGDCFSYALATTTGRPLLFKGADFARTDVLRAR